MKSIPGAVPAGGAMLQVYEYVCANRAGHADASSSCEKSAPLSGSASSACGSNGRPAVVSAMRALTGLIPQVSEVNRCVRGSDRLPSLSRTITVTSQSAPATSATNVGFAAVMLNEVSVLSGGRVIDQRYETAIGLEKHNEVGLAVASVTVSSRKNRFAKAPVLYPGVLPVTEISPAFGTTSGQLTVSAVNASARCCAPPTTVSERS